MSARYESAELCLLAVSARPRGLNKCRLVASSRAENLQLSSIGLVPELRNRPQAGTFQCAASPLRTSVRQTDRAS